MSKIAFFSSAEPLHTGIATYFTKLLGALSDYRPDLTIDVYIDDGYTPDEFRGNRIRFLHHSLFHENSGSYDSVLFQIGNDNRYHGYMLPYLKKYGGIVELHEINFQALFIPIIESAKNSLSRFKLSALARLMFIYPELRFFAYYRISRLFRTIDKRGYMEKKFFRSTFLIKNARTIIIRDPSLIRHYRLPEKKCAVIIHGIDIKPLPAADERARIRKRLDLSEDQFVIVSAGIINKFKKIDRVIRALAAIRGKMKNFTYVLAGDYATDEFNLQPLIAESGLEDHVRITGWLSNRDWFDYITIADVGINLRRDSLGEHSGPICNFIERGKVTLISDLEQYRLYPDEFAIKIPDDENEIPALSEKILWLYNNPDLRSRAGAAARAFALERLDFNAVIACQYCRLMGIE